MIRSIERRIIAQHRSDEASKRLRSIPGIGIVGATAIAATVPDPRSFDRVVTLRPGSGSYRGNRPAANRSSGRFRSRRPISETHSGGGSPCGVEAGAPPTGEVSVGHTTSRTQTVQGRGCGGCQQDGARRLGVIGKGRQLSGACTCGGGVRVWREQSEFASVRI